MPERLLFYLEIAGAPDVSTEIWLLEANVPLTQGHNASAIVSSMCYHLLNDATIEKHKLLSYAWLLHGFAPYNLETCSFCEFL